MARPKGRKRRPKLASNRTEHSLINALDDLAEFQEFRGDLLIKVRQALKSGMKSEEILDFGRAYAAARLVNIAATEDDSAKALAAIKDILDRTQGKAVERKQVVHALSNLPDDQLDSIIMSEVEYINEED